MSYGSVRANRNVDITVEDGGVVGIIGANGAGKSTLLQALCGLVPSSSGSVQLDGTDLSRASAWERVRAGLALSPEGRGVIGGMTVEDNLTLGAFTVKRSRRHELPEQRSMVLDLFPRLGERLHQDAGTLSGGEAAMLSIGRALMSSPKVLLLDEPTLGLAPIVTEQLFEKIGELAKLGTTMLVVEQRATQLLHVADRLVHMKSGEVVAVTDAADVDEARLSDLYFGVA